MCNKGNWVWTTISVFVVLLGLPIILSLLTGGNVPFCSIGSVDAQDNPCLAQEATNSALQLQFQQLAFQATLDSVNHQATVTALQSPVDTETGVSSPGLPFFDDFNNNDNGWRLLRGISLVSGTLNLEWDREDNPSVPIPPVGNFYILVDVKDDNGESFDIWVGDFVAGNFHGLICRNGNDRIIVFEYRNGERQSTLYDVEVPTNFRYPYTCAISYQNGQFDVYINDEYIMTGQFVTFGGEIRLGGDSTVQIESIEIRGSR